MNSSNNLAKMDKTTIPDLKPTAPKPDWAKDIDDNMQVVIDKLSGYGDPPIESLSAQQARQGHTPTDAVMDVIKENNIAQPAPMCDTMGKDIPVDRGSIHARIYTPKKVNSSYPLIVYYHGGGWVIADLNTYDPSAKALCEQTGAVVVSVGVDVNYKLYDGVTHEFFGMATVLQDAKDAQGYAVNDLKKSFNK